jgi:hypothetical protein
MAKPKHPGELMTLGNMRHLGVHRLVAYCLNRSCRHEGLIRVEICGRCRSPVIRSQSHVCEVRRARPTHRRAAALEGTADAAFTGRKECR